MISIGLLGGGAGIPADGLQYWGKADTFNLSNDTAVTSWTDISGNGRNFTSASALFKTNSTPRGGPAISATAAFTRANVLAGATSAEIHFVYKANSFDQPMEQNWGNDTSNGNHWPWNSGPAVYTDWGRSSRLGPLSVGIVATGTWYKVCMWTASNDWALYVNDVSKYTTSSNTVSWYNGNCDFGINCTTAEIIAYNRKLSTTERTQVFSYLDRHF